MKSLEFRKDELVEFFRDEFHEQAAEVMAEAAVIEFLRIGKLSAGKGAQLLGLTRSEFDEVLSKHDVPSFELLPGETMAEHLERGDEALRRIRGQA